MWFLARLGRQADSAGEADGEMTVPVGGVPGVTR